jgi:hypothetical protein
MVAPPSPNAAPSRSAPRPDRLAAAHRVARDATGMAKDLARDLAEGYRRSSRYLRMRAAVAGTWSLLALGTLWLACPSSGTRNALGAEIQLAESIVGTQVVVQNDSERAWTEISLVLDGGWRYERKTVRPGEKLILGVTQFRKDGAPAPGDLRPRSIRIDCEQGQVAGPLTQRAP